MVTQTDAGLADFVASVAGEGVLRVEESLGHGYVRLRVDEAERRQARHDIRRVEDAVIELLRNARDAGATHVYLATSREADERGVVVLDDGCGIPAELAERVFDARVTSKLDSVGMDEWGVHGRGMALYSIRHNAELARIEATGEGLGTSVAVRFDCGRVPERADQSTLPELVCDEDGCRLGPGPRNIARAVLEFALSCEGVVEIYLGSPAEVAALLYARDPAGLSLREILFGRGDEGVPVCSRLRAAADAVDLARRSEALGLHISERTAQRILAGEVSPATAPLARLRRDARRDRGQVRPIDLERDRRGLRISSQDADEFRDGLRRAFEPLARRYYLDLAGDPSVRVAVDHLVVTFPIVKR